MGMRAELEMLAVLLLLTPIVSDGLVMTKCQLFSQLMSTVPADVPDRENLLAKMVCRSEQTSHFDTSLVNPVPSPGVPGIRKTRAAPRTPSSPSTTNPSVRATTNLPPEPTENPKAQTTTLPPYPVENLDSEINQTELPIPLQFPSPYPPMFNSTFMNPRHKRGVREKWTLYGVFQLADRIACTSPKHPSFNICNLSCDKLIDDDITDDINCAMTLITSKPMRMEKPDGQEDVNRLISTMTGMLLNTCPTTDFAQYLAECNVP